MNSAASTQLYGVSLSSPIGHKSIVIVIVLNIIDIYIITYMFVI